MSGGSDQVARRTADYRNSMENTRNMKNFRGIARYMALHYILLFIITCVVKILFLIMAHFLTTHEINAVITIIAGFFFFYAILLFALFSYRKIACATEQHFAEKSRFFTTAGLLAVVLTHAGFIMFSRSIMSSIITEPRKGIFVFRDFKNVKSPLFQYLIKIKPPVDLHRNCKYTVPSNSPSILLVGDSFIYDFRIEVNDTLCTTIGDSLARKNVKDAGIFNAAVPGINMSSSIRLADYYASKKNPDWIVIGYSSGNAFRTFDTFERINLLKNNRAFQIISALLGGETVSIAYQWYSNYIVRPRRLSDGDLRLLAHLAESSRIIVFSYGKPDPFLAKLKTDVKDIHILYFDLHENALIDPELVVPNDGHPTGKANRIIGDMIAAYISTTKK